MNLWNRRAARADNERNGIVIRVAEYPGFAFKVRPFCDWNDDLQRARVALAMRPDVRDFLKRTADPTYEPTASDKAFDKALEVETFVRGCLVSWEGIPGPDGEPFEFTVDNAVMLFEHFPDVYVTVRRMASDTRNFQPKDPDELAEKAAGNLKRVSRSKSAAGAS